MRPLFAHMISILPRIAHAQVDPNRPNPNDDQGNHDPPLPDNQRQLREQWMDHWHFVNNHYVGALENHLNQALGVADGEILVVLPPLRHLLIRLAQPGGAHSQENNQAALDQLRVTLHEWDYQTNVIGEPNEPLIGFGELNQLNRITLHGILRAVVSQGDTNDEISPQRADRVPNMGRIVNRFRDRSRAVEFEDTHTYLNLMREMLSSDERLWIIDVQNALLHPTYRGFERFLRALENFLVWTRRVERVPDPPHEVILWQYQQSWTDIRQYDVENSPIGSIRVFLPVLFGVWEMLRQMDPPRLVV